MRPIALKYFIHIYIYRAYMNKSIYRIYINLKYSNNEIVISASVFAKITT